MSKEPSEKVKVRDSSYKSVCQWELEFYFKSSKQTKDFIIKLLESEIENDFTYYTDLDDTNRRFYVNVKGCWAVNLTDIAKILEEVDFDEV